MTTKIDIVSGFLGAGKTTLIKKLLKEALNGTKVVLIENEFGEIGVDGGFLKDAGIEIKEMNAGCICCSLVGDFGASLREVLTSYAPERVLIEPSGVGKLSDVAQAVENVAGELDVKVNSAVAVVDASKCKMYVKNFGEFFINQIEYAGTIILSRTGNISKEKLDTAIELIRQYNKEATIITTPWDELQGSDILETIEGADKLDDMMAEMLEKAKEEEHEHHHHHDGECCCGHAHEHEHEHHHHHDDDEECCCGHDHEHHHDHDDDDDEVCPVCGGHHHHDDDEHEHDHDHHDHDHHDHHDHDHHDHDHHDHDHHDHDHHEHEHHHEYDENGVCSCGHHHGHGHHHADEVFTSFGMETANQYSQEDIAAILTALDSGDYGMILRSKGMVASPDGTWTYFDYVPEEQNIRSGKALVTGKICVIGSKLKEDKLKELFRK